jgi:hypothetical protein
MAFGGSSFGGIAALVEGMRGDAGCGFGSLLVESPSLWIGEEEPETFLKVCRTTDLLRLAMVVVPRILKHCCSSTTATMLHTKNLLAFQGHELAGNYDVHAEHFTYINVAKNGVAHSCPACCAFIDY